MGTQPDLIGPAYGTRLARRIDLVLPEGIGAQPGVTGAAHGKRLARRIDRVLPKATSAMRLDDSGRARRGRIAALGTRLLKAWLGLYAPPPRRPRQIV